MIVLQNSQVIIDKWRCNFFGTEELNNMVKYHLAFNFTVNAPNIKLIQKICCRFHCVDIGYNFIHIFFYLGLWARGLQDLSISVQWVASLTWSLNRCHSFHYHQHLQQALECCYQARTGYSNTATWCCVSAEIHGHQDAVAPANGSGTNSGQVSAGSRSVKN